MPPFESSAGVPGHADPDHVSDLLTCWLDSASSGFPPNIAALCPCEALLLIVSSSCIIQQSPWWANLFSAAHSLSHVSFVHGSSAMQGTVSLFYTGFCVIPDGQLQGDPVHHM